MEENGDATLQPGDRVTVVGSPGGMNIWAIWTKLSDTPHHDSQGGSAVPDMTGVAWDGKNLVNVPDPTRPGYTFAGWYASADSTIQEGLAKVDNDIPYSVIAKANGLDRHLGTGHGRLPVRQVAAG